MNLGCKKEISFVEFLFYLFPDFHVFYPSKNYYGDLAVLCQIRFILSPVLANRSHKSTSDDKLTSPDISHWYKNAAATLVMLI